MADDGAGNVTTDGGAGLFANGRVRYCALSSSSDRPDKIGSAEAEPVLFGDCL
jgi:hypothetical protein